MSIELLQTLSLVSYIVAAVLFLSAIAMFFLLDIRKVFGDVTGRSARKAIENIRQQSEAGADNHSKPGASKADGAWDDDRAPKTEKFETAVLNPQAAGQPPSPGAGNETTVLSQNGGDSGATTVLSQPEPVPPANFGTNAFSIDVEMGFTGSSEIIE